MTDKIILDIRHRDQYTDYLFMTAAFTNRRVVPLIDPGRDEIGRLSDANTAVIRCYDSRKEIREGEEPVVYNEGTETLLVLSRFYLDDRGTFDFDKARVVRAMVEKVVTERLLDPGNLLEAFRLNFPVLWAGRHRIYAEPQLFFARSGWYGIQLNDCFPVGTILKTIEEDPVNFRLSLRGGCGCNEKPILVDYPSRYGCGPYWTLHTWCPKCGSRREIRTRVFWRVDDCDASLEKTRLYYDKGQGFSPLSLLDVIDALQDDSSTKAQGK